ncbi:glycyl-radical enzyme activating protein [Enterococcus sp. LJL98]
MTIPLVFNIQNFSIHDGPGIRTTVFFKGCPIRCAWCHNPESQKYRAETIVRKNGKQETVGRPYTVEELIHEIKKDKVFYEYSNGGVTLSGGEVMAQDMDYLEALVKGLKAEQISVAIDTCGVAPQASFERLLPYVDLFLYDLKMLDSHLHRQYTKQGNAQVLANLKYLSQAKATLCLRLILLEGINTSEAQVQALIDWLVEESIQIDSIHLLPYHEFGREKYRGLNRSWEKFEAPSAERLEAIKAHYEAYHFIVKIGG